MDDKIGNRITDISIIDNKLSITFDSLSILEIRDKERLCCEQRYMTCDDELKEYIGSKFLGVEIKDVIYEQDEWSESCEIQFLEIKTTKGSITIANHNEHNGYYSGFDIAIEIKD